MDPKPITYSRAKRMRKEPTDAERKLWGALRGRRLAGIKFYRQVPIGPYIVDFLNQEFCVVIEVDGFTHSSDAELKHDLTRTAYLENLGLLVHRVDNAEVLGNIGTVLDGVYAVLIGRGVNRDL